MASVIAADKARYGPKPQQKTFLMAQKFVSSPRAAARKACCK